MLPTLSLGPFVLPTGGVVAILGVWAALTAVERGAARRGLDVEATYALAATALLAGVIAARAFFVFLYWPAFAANPVTIVWPLTTGYQPLAGLAAGIVVAGWFIGNRRLPFPAVLDALAPGLLSALVAYHLADFLAGPGYGDETTRAWGILQFGVRRHPVQLYHIATLLLALYVWLWATRRAASMAAEPGVPFLLAMAVAAAGYVLITPWQANPWLLTGGWHGGQVAGLATLLVSLAILARRSGGSGDNTTTTGA